VVDSALNSKVKLFPSYPQSAQTDPKNTPAGTIDPQRNFLEVGHERTIDWGSSSIEDEASQNSLILAEIEVLGFARSTTPST
jgi:hypothetical protein